MPTKEPILKRVAALSGCSYGYVRTVTSERLTETAAQKTIMRLYTELLQEQVDALVASIKHEATNDFN